MDVRIQAIHFDASEQLVNFINKKAERLARRHTAITAIDADLHVVKPECANNKEVVIRITMPDAPEMVATKTADTFEEAVDLALDALDRQLDKIKDRK